MINIDDYDLGYTNSINDDDMKEYLDDLEADYWIDEYKNNPDLM